jgi:hypothetical protein
MLIFINKVSRIRSEDDIWVAKITGIFKSNKFRREFIAGTYDSNVFDRMEFDVKPDCIVEIKQLGQYAYYHVVIMKENNFNSEIKKPMTKNQVIEFFESNQNPNKQIMSRNKFIFRNCPIPPKQLIRRKVNHVYNNSL